MSDEELFGGVAGEGGREGGELLLGGNAEGFAAEQFVVVREAGSIGVLSDEGHVDCLTLMKMPGEEGAL